MVKLYELTGAYAQIAALAEDETDGSKWEAALADLKGGIEEKAENLVRLIRCLDTDAEAFEAESRRLGDLARSRRNRVAGLKDYLLRCLREASLSEVKTQLFKVRVMASPPSCHVLDEDLVPKEWKRCIPEKWFVDAKAILASWGETSEAPPGTEITRGVHLRIW